MNDVVISVENLSKKYIISHLADKREQLFSNLLMSKAKNLFSRGKKVLSSPFTIHHSPFTESTEEFWALKDVSFEIKQGDRVGIIGRNGAGKSTLLKILSRITEPTKGRITIDGRVASLLEVGTGFHSELSGRENIYLNGAILGMGREEIKRKFDEIVAFAEVERFLDTPVKRYSSGMYVRLAFAVAAHLEPEILIVDEVLAVGDVSFQKKCLGKMKDVGKEGRTVLFVSHNMTAIQSLCSTGIFLDKGMIVSTAGIMPVVEDYLKSVMTHQDDIPLEKMTNRRGGQRLRFSSYKLYGSDSLENLPLACGGDGRIEIEFCSIEPFLDHLRFGIEFRERISGLPLIEFNSYYGSNENFSCRNGVHKMTFEVKKFPLKAGEYMVGLIATSGLDILDWVKDAGMATIHEGDFYSTGKMPIADETMFHHEFTCSLDRS